MFEIKITHSSNMLPSVEVIVESNRKGSDWEVFYDGSTLIKGIKTLIKRQVESNKLAQAYKNGDIKVLSVENRNETSNNIADPLRHVPLYLWTLNTTHGNLFMYRAGDDAWHNEPSLEDFKGTILNREQELPSTSWKYYYDKLVEEYPEFSYRDMGWHDKMIHKAFMKACREIGD